LLAVDGQLLHRHDREPLGLEPGQDVADQAAAYGVGLDQDERALSHVPQPSETARAITSPGTGVERASPSGTGTPATNRSGMCPPQTSAATSSGSSTGPPARAFIDASRSGTA